MTGVISEAMRLRLVKAIEVIEMETDKRTLSSSRVKATDCLAKTVGEWLAI